ncbi:YhgE/Pip domain-containing protein [Paenibacillus sp. YIM B09110]|uniref:YhgE/Pip domain-containing protein n=1 Tax=Paenibacillus sp. YIM B09110 TaxID=3126102 RepID=UPI00301D9FA3
MRKIASIYAGDLRSIATNISAAILVLGLACLPCLYAWFNIKASWDPYGQTGGLSIAVVDNDKGATLRDTAIHAGRDIIDSLKENRSIGWMFTDGKDALKGVKHGDYYASITIPEDFSAKLATVLDDNPQQAEINYVVNEKINAVSPKITQKGASGIIEQVSRAFVLTANETIFRLFNEIGIELETNLPAIEKVRDTVFKLETLIPEINQAVQVAADDINKSKKVVSTLQTELPKAAQLAKDGEAFTAKLTQFLSVSTQLLDTIGPSVKQDLQLLAQAANTVEQLTSALGSQAADPEALKASLSSAADRLSTASSLAGSLISTLEGLSQTAGSERLDETIQRLQQVSTRLQQQSAILERIQEAVNKGEQPAEDLITQLQEQSSAAASLLTDILGRYDSEILPNITQAAKNAAGKADQAHGLLVEAGNAIPAIENIVNDAAKGLALGGEKFEEARKSLPAAEAKVQALAARIRELEKEGNLNELIGLLRNNAQRESAFFAEPVVLNEQRLFPIPNYGSAMSPFYTTLSLWVGALLLVSLLTVDMPEQNESESYRSYEVYIGRYLTFLTIAIVQALLVTSGDLWLLNAYAADKGWFIAFGVLLSSVFMLIVYTLVSIFGNVGKAMAIVLLVLQLGGSGGTFPVQVTPPFFQAIHPFLPFTYAISLMREAVGGILWDVVLRDVLVLAAYAGLTLLLGLALKKPINRYAKRMVDKARESRLLH